MRWPQIVWIVWLSVALGINLAKHGEENRSKYNFLQSSIVFAAEAALLYAGGFFG